jgi:SAM-dependent methyltransferase
VPPPSHPPAAEAPLFDWPFYQAITEARLAHLESLSLPVDGRSVVDLGSGIGRLSEYFVSRGCEVTCVDGREDNIAELRRLYPGRRARVVDVETDELLSLGQFDVVFCYGLLYHLADPFGFLLRAAKMAGELLVLETCIADAEEAVVFLVQDPDDPTMALRAIASRPSPAYVAAALRSGGLEHVYSPRSLPDHPDFRYRRLNDLSYFRDGHALRSVFVASRTPLDDPGLRALPVSGLPPESG